MTQALIEQARTFEAQTIQLVATEMGEPLYKKVGFRNIGEYAFMKEGETTEPTTRCTSYHPKYREEILALDFAASGEDRQTLLEPHLSQALVYCGDRLSGFYMPTLGEGLIIADNEEAGISLMKNKLARAWLYIAIPRGNPPALEFLKSLGHKEYRVGKRMALGPEIPWHPKMIFGRIGGNLG